MIRWAAVVAACALIAAWMLRWQLVEARHPDASSAYLLDRWTGSVYLLSNQKRFEVTPFKPGGSP